ncbi:diaminopimelate epimerase [Candidatus Endolissoclinum faulkneri L5]|uniref:Diaminopimelate epimerase n=1 Tax=Candidatus Endolissoclinum faulkneri L5 TaxID=1401328 RepID=V9TRC1_9PROT|nr:diaminopimelate epimerase [Candidatus Endolissoclinum faulkneri]AHC73449.1 diaminopimelate epimerase [Candidatus Endolissoclinum faulkneri L5]
MINELAFIKMHGLGNDFIVLDGRKSEVALSQEQFHIMSDRCRGVGCNQLLTILPPKDKGFAYVEIHNSDGSLAEACGNGIRCVASLLMDEDNVNKIVLETMNGSLVCTRSSNECVTVCMGKPNFNWSDIPIAVETDTLKVTVLGAESYGPATMVNIGNPHAVFFVDDVEILDLLSIGPLIENNLIFPKRSNVEFVKVLSPNRLRVRFWERGAGMTQACGSGACATVVAGILRGVINGRSASVVQDGGILDITWGSDEQVYMTGPVAISFLGIIDFSIIKS